VNKDARTRPVVVVHAGAGGPRENDTLCTEAAGAGLSAFADGQSALEAAIRATVVLEDDPRGNAGTGSNLRLDGKTIEMDAAVMDSDLRFGAVAAIQRVQNPVRVAERVLATPHLLLAGGGATSFARAQGFEDFEPWTEKAQKKWERVMALLAEGKGRAESFPAWAEKDPEQFWNFPGSLKGRLAEILGPADTVGAVARDEAGRFGAALSTGGTSLMLLGRVGDTPLIGAGLYAGPEGAAACTGEGEEIMRRVLAKRVYDWMDDGMGAQEASERGVALVPPSFTVGVIAVSPRDAGVADNRTMPRAVKYR
jgi:L-asparaginase/beta-aspartyl-peptidase (threonine type)